LSNWAIGRFGDLKVVAVSSQPEQLRDRTKAFALRVIRLYRSLPYKTDAQVLGKQLLRFVAKIGVVVEEADEAVLWLELMTESGIVPLAKMEALLKEANELTAIFGGLITYGEACTVSFQSHNRPITQLLNCP
jgi:hypothetical protein